MKDKNLLEKAMTEIAAQGWPQQAVPTALGPAGIGYPLVDDKTLESLRKSLEDLKDASSNWVQMSKPLFDEAFTDMLEEIIVDDPTGDGLKWTIKLRDKIYKRNGWKNASK